MPLFRPKGPAAILEAERLSKENAEAVALWCGGLLITEIDAEDPLKVFVGINVPTQLGVDRAGQGDWIVKHKGGNFSVFSPEGFEATYEPIM